MVCVERPTSAASPTRSRTAGRRQIVLPDVDAVGARQAGDVGAIVDDDAGLVLMCELDYRGRGGEQGVAGHRLRAQLQVPGAAAQIRRGQIEDRPSGAGGGVDVEDGTQRGQIWIFSFADIW